MQSFKPIVSIDLPPFDAGKYAALIDTLPDVPGDATCCGENGCDGYGHVHEDSGVRPCINVLRADLMIGGVEPKLFNERRLEPGFQKTNSVRAIYEICGKILIKAEPSGLCLCGGHGTTKTTSANDLMLECVSRGIHSIMIQFPDLIRAKKRGVDGNPFYDSRMSAVRRSRLVVVDEIGRGEKGGQDHHTDVLEDIFRLCHQQRFLICITNIPKVELVNAYPPYVVSRMGGFTVIEESYNMLEDDLRWKIRG